MPRSRCAPRLSKRTSGPPTPRACSRPSAATSRGLHAVQTAQIKYEAYTYTDTKITRVTDDVAIMTGRARMRASAGDVHVDFALKFLSVWRRESGAWRLFAYQSAKLADPAVVK